MKLDEAIEIALDGEAIMFAGSGCSSGATNIKGQPFRRGTELANFLSEKCGLQIGTSLDDAAEEYAAKHGDDGLIQELRQEFTVKDIARHHSDLARIPWKRIYTTNYDNVLETAYSKELKRLTPIMPNDNPYSTSQSGTLCIHFNGFIDRLDKQSLWTDFKLTDTSYLSASIADSDWAMMFRQDIRLARAVFFVGYSLYDLDIKRILYENPALKEKSLFILGVDPVQTTVRRAEKFGTVIKQTVAEFVKRVDERKQVYSPIDQDRFTTLSIKEHKASVPAPISDQDFINLLLYGTIKKELVAESYRTGKKYYFERTATKQVFDFIEKGHDVLVICSDLGNGKSLFLEGLCHVGLENQYRVFEVQERNEEASAELEKIAKLPEQSLVIMENYQDWLDEIRLFRMNSTIKKVLILTARNSIHDVVFNDLISIVGAENIPEIQLDLLTNSEIVWFVEVLEEYGLWGDYAAGSKTKKINFIKESCNSQIHAILLKLFQSPAISSRLRSLSEEIKEKRVDYEAILSIFILNLLGQSPKVDTLVDLWGTKIFGSKKNVSMCQLIDFSHNEINVKSSVAAEYFLKNLSDSAVVVHVLISLAKKCHDLSRLSVRYKDLFRNLMKFSNVQSVLPDEGKRSAIIRFYESIKNLNSCKRNPLFWLQYAIACLIIEDLPRSKRYFDTAYSLANELQWDTFQIDNHYARYLLLVESSDPKELMTNFSNAQMIINQQIKQERFRYGYRTATRYKVFLDRSYKFLTASNLERITRAASHVLQRISELPENRKKHSAVSSCKSAMEYVMNRVQEITEERKKDSK